MLELNRIIQKVELVRKLRTQQDNANALAMARDLELNVLCLLQAMSAAESTTAYCLELMAETKELN